MSDTLLRQMIILQNLPQYPRKVTTRSLLELLEAQGIQTTIRTVQRDLETLSNSGIFGINSDKGRKPSGWYWLKRSRQLQIPYMDISTAVAFSLIESEAGSMLPAEIRAQLEPFFSQSHELLKNRNDWTLKLTKSKPARNKTLNISEKDKDLIYTAIDKQLCLAAQVGRFLKGVDMQYMHYTPIHPVGLRLEDGDVYLVCHFGVPKRVTLLALYRFKDVEILEQPADTSRILELENDCEKRLNEVFHTNVELIFEFNANLLKEIVIAPISDNQHVSTLPNGSYLLTAVINDDRKLRQRLLRLGPHVTVVKPQSLAAIIKYEAIKTIDNYQRRVDS